MKPITLTLLLISAASASACSSGAPVDLGENDGSQLSEYAASWDGYVEAFTFPKGNSGRIRLILDAAGSGTLEVGDAPLFPPPSDPTVGYPVGELPDGTHRLRDGFRYPIHEARVEAKRIQFWVDRLEPFKSWCESQTPSLQIGGGYACLPDSIASEVQEDPSLPCFIILPTEERMQIDCGKWRLCAQGFCKCDASSCTSNDWDTRIPFDAALEGSGSRMVGTLVLREDQHQRFTVRLERN